MREPERARRHLAVRSDIQPYGWLRKSHAGHLAATYATRSFIMCPRNKGGEHLASLLLVAIISISS